MRGISWATSSYASRIPARRLKRRRRRRSRVSSSASRRRSNSRTSTRFSTRSEGSRKRRSSPITRSWRRRCFPTCNTGPLTTVPLPRWERCWRLFSEAPASRHAKRPRANRDRGSERRIGALRRRDGRRRSPRRRPIWRGLELHVWGSRADKLDRPDTLVFDIDPDPTVPWAAVTDAAREARDLLDRVGLVSFVKTTGGKGLHVVVPIDRKTDWTIAKDFTRAVAAKLVAASPARYTDNPLKVRRQGKIFVDYLRNDRGSTAVAPYSSRASARATVATPVRVGARSSASIRRVSTSPRYLDA